MTTRHTGDAPESSGASPMTAAEFRAVIEWLGLRQRDAATLLGVAERTVRSWCSGQHPVPEGVRDELARLEDYTDDCIDAAIQALDHRGARHLVTFASDEAYHRAHPTATLPAGWHRQVAARVRSSLPGLRLIYRGDDT